jgi:divalent metal cation (Fe/Co/Zn/Cd) transporter
MTSSPRIQLLAARPLKASASRTGAIEDLEPDPGARWQCGHDPRIPHRAPAQKAVAVSFWLLAPCIAIEAIRDLAAHHPATATPLGITLTASSLVIMPVLGMAKRRLGERLGSGATAGEGTQKLMCAAQAAGVLLALAGVAIWPGGWPIAPIIALGIAGWSAWEGNRSWRGADCC